MFSRIKQQTWSKYEFNEIEKKFSDSNSSQLFYDSKLVLVNIDTWRIGTKMFTWILVSAKTTIALPIVLLDYSLAIIKSF